MNKRYCKVIASLPHSSLTYLRNLSSVNYLLAVRNADLIIFIFDKLMLTTN